MSDSALKHMYGRDFLKRVATAIADVDSAFVRTSILGLMPELDSLEMKPRVRRVRDEFHRQLIEIRGLEYPQALQILLKSVRTGKLRGFDLWPYTEFIQQHGLTHVELSLDALKELTPIFTAEWAVRPFIRLHSKKTMKFLKACAQDTDEHVRRWSSEGSRPRLPWGERLQDFVRDPSPALPILETLKYDDSLYVRKSVSNHLNDISKDHPLLVIEILKAWQQKAKQKDQKKVSWIIHRSLRSLIKAGNPGALGLIGVTGKPKVKISGFKLSTNKIKMGERIGFAFAIKSQSSQSQKIVVDYVVHFMKSNGKQAAKVFKLKSFDLPAGETLKIEKSHHIKKITTREYYSGQHRLEIQVNGQIAAGLDWHLKI